MAKTLLKKNQYQKVRTEKQANTVIYAYVYGWRGDRRLEPQTIRGFYRAGEDALWDIQCGGSLLSIIADKIFADWKAKRPAGQDWSISECWSRDAQREKKVR